MLKCQKHLFSLSKNVTYLNGAYMSPMAKTVEFAGYQGIIGKKNPSEISPIDFFDPIDVVRKLYAELINAPDFQQIAMMPSVSYGIATVAKNIDINKGENIILLEEQFPSNVYTWHRKAEETGAKIKTIKAPKPLENRAKNWNKKVLKSIDKKTKIVALPHVHWADGTLFELEKIGKRCREVGAYLIIDGTQSVGALPFDIQKIKPDALICGGYKWLMGPYSSGLAYFGPRFEGGTPLEESWMYRKDSHIFSNLVNYQSEYQPKATRYNVGQASNFTLLPMIKAALEMLLGFGIANVQEYCRETFKEGILELEKMGAQIEEEKYRSSHLFGVRTGQAFDLKKLQKQFKKKEVFVSTRGNSIRISPNVYNDVEDMEVLLKCFKKARR